MRVVPALALAAVVGLTGCASSTDGLSPSVDGAVSADTPATGSSSAPTTTTASGSSTPTSGSPSSSTVRPGDGLYVTDDPAAREGSHPLFLAAAPDWFFDTSGFSPFAGDAGWDSLYFLQQWYLDDGADGEVASDFLPGLEADFGYGIPDEIWELDRQATVDWLADGNLAAALLNDLTEARIAIALGQFKIRGGMTDDLRAVATAAIAVSRQSLEILEFPLTHQDKAAGTTRLDDLQQVIDAAPALP